MTTAAALPREDSFLQRLSTSLYLRPRLLLLMLLGPPLLWLGVIYLGSLFALLAQSFFAVDEFSGVVVQEFSLATWSGFLTNPANGDIVLRTFLMAVVVTIAAALIAFPIAYYMVRFAGIRIKAMMYLGVMLPLWSSYLVRVYVWRLILSKDGVLNWALENIGLGSINIGYSNWAIWIVFSYIWLPFMILPIWSAFERVPDSYIEASADLGARGWRTFRTVVFPLILPGIAAGSIFTFALTLGDFITPTLVGGAGSDFIGNVVFQNVGIANDVPFAAAFAVVPLLIMGVYLLLARRLGAFEAL